MLASILELNARASDKVTNYTGHEDLSRLGSAADPLGCVNRDPCDVIIGCRSTSPTWIPQRMLTPSADRIRSGLRERMAAAGPSKVASTPSPVVFTSRPPKRDSCLSVRTS